MSYNIARRLGSGIGVLAATLGVTTISSIILGTLLFFIYNIMVIGLFSHTPITIVQSVGLVAICDILMTPGAVVAFRLMSGAFNTSNKDEVSSIKTEGVSQPESNSSQGS